MGIFRMAILTGITNAVRANLAGAASKAVSNVATDIKSIAGLNPTGSNSALGKVSHVYVEPLLEPSPLEAS